MLRLRAIEVTVSPSGELPPFAPAAEYFVRAWTRRPDGSVGPRIEEFVRPEMLGVIGPALRSRGLTLDHLTVAAVGDIDLE